MRGSRYEGGWRFQVELEPAPKADRTDPPASAAGAPPVPAPNPITNPSPAEAPAGANVQASGVAAEPGGEEDAEKGTLEGEEETLEPGSTEPERDWAPLLYAPAAGEAPAVAVRRPLAPARPPAPERKWEAGDRAEVRLLRSCTRVAARLAPGKLSVCCGAAAVAGRLVRPPRRTKGNRRQRAVHLPVLLHLCR